MHTLVKRIFVQPHRWSASLPIDFCGPRRATCNEYEYIPFYSLNHIPAFVALLLCALLPAWHSMMHTHSYNGYKRSSNMLRIYECEIQNSRAMEKCQRGANANATHTFFSLLLPELGRSSFSSFIQRMQLAHNRPTVQQQSRTNQSGHWYSSRKLCCRRICALPFSSATVMALYTEKSERKLKLYINVPFQFFHD